ncbi:MAG TPA: Holliday junction resolvase RuvX [Candidatus Binataceae bacterium]|nr:Holliday junction resolvase RuvX [Candidatus Binataceae bacterium]
MTIVAVDFGKKRIGLAISDPAQSGAYPLGTVERRSTALDLADIQRRIADREVTRIVVGLPLNMDGSEGSIARAARSFGARLEAHLGLPVDFHDERLSSVEADERMRPLLSRRRRKAVLDSVAAAVILEGWLQAHPRPDCGDAQG